MKNPIRFLLHVPVPWVFVLSYLLGVGLERTRPISLCAKCGLMSTIAGTVMFGTGALIAGWGLVIFRKARTTTVPGKASVRLVTWGPYRMMRNPMYVGLILAYLGEAALMRQLWPVAVLPLTIAYVHWMVIPLEEAKLQEVFGEQYAQYRLHASRWV